MTPLRSLNPELRRARLLAARSRNFRSVTRKGILTGQWDGGSVVRSFTTDNDVQPPAKET